MKPRNFPARKLARQIGAKEGISCRDVDKDSLKAARDVRTKKFRGK